MDATSFGIDFESRARKAVSVFGSGQCKPGDPSYDEAWTVGRLFAEKGWAVFTGAYGGVMEAAAKGAKNAGGHALGMALGKDGPKPNEFLTYSVDCAEEAKGIRIPNVAFGVRLAGLMSADGFVLVEGGGIGSMLELVAFLLFATKLWPKDGVIKRMAVLATDSPNQIELDTFRSFLKAGLITDEVCGGIIRFVGNPEEAVAWVLDGKVEVDAS